MPSLWDNFTNILKGVGSGILDIPKGLIGTIAQSGAQLGAAQTFKGSPEAAAAAGIAAETGIARSLAKAGLGTIEKPIAKATDPVLYVAEKAEKYVFSPIIARPISTVNLLTDPTSPLYNSDTYGKGFQPSDVIDAYNRSEKVSLGVSMLKSQINPLGILESAILKSGGIDVENVNLWDDNDIKKNFQDNTLGKWVTGTNDFIIKNVAINAAFVGAAAGIKAAGLKAGLGRTIKVGDVDAMPKFEDLANQHINYRKSGGTQGNLTVLGQDIEDLAASENIIDIVRIASKHSNNSRLPNLIRNTKDPEFVRDLLLADKAYGPAIERLTQAGLRDKLWYLGDGNNVVRGAYIETNKMPTYTVDQRARWMGAFDDAIKANPKHQEIYDAFLKQTSNPETGILEVSAKFLGKPYKPAEPIIGRAAFAAARSRAGQIKTARLERDFSKVGGVTQSILGSNIIGEPATVLIRTFGTMMPKGFITNSGLRPLNGVDELMATFDDIPMFRRGDKVITTHLNEQMTVSQYRTTIIDNFVSAQTDGARADIIKNLNLELARTISFSRGFYDVAKIDDFVNNLMENVYAIHGDLRIHGHAMDPSGVRLTLHPQTQSQLQNAMPTLPFGELDRLLARAARREKNIVTGTVQQGGGVARDSIKGVFELGNKAFSLATLYRFSYIPKNSVFEPILSGVMAEGSTFASAMATTASKRVIENSVNYVLRNIEKSKTILPSAKKEIQREVKALSDQYNIAVNNADILVAKHEQMFADVPGVSPATKRDWADLVKSDLRAAEKIIDDIESKMNKYTVEYGNPIDVPSVFNLRRRIQTLKDVDKTEKRELFPDIAEYKDGGSGGIPGTRSTVGLVKVSALKDMPGNALSNTEGIEAIRKSLRAGKGFATREYQGKPYQDPIMVVYDNETGLAYIGEGNHRFQAAIAENIPYVPVRVVRGNKEEMIGPFDGGRKPKQIKNGREPEFVETVGSGIGKPVSPGYVPPEMHPSFVFDKKFIVEKDEFLQSTNAARFGSDIGKAELVLQKAIGNINTMAPELNIMSAEIEAAYNSIGTILNSLGPKLVEKANIFSVAEGRYISKPIMPDTVTRVASNGQKFTFPSLTNENYLGNGYFSEIANNNTRTLEVLGNKTTVAKINTMTRNSPQSITNVADPLYFDELAYVVNTHMRNDILIDQILAGAGREELLSWAATNQGSSYAANMARSVDDLTELVDEAISYVNRYLPSAEARALAATGPIKVTDLQRTLADKLNEMVPIQPLDIPYGRPTTATKAIGMSVDAAMSNAWRFLAKPENVMRQVWGTIDHANRTMVKVESLIAQGQEVTLGTVLAMREAAAIEMVENVSKVFYTIPRQSRALYLSRILVTFPNAAASGIYRYGGFAAKQPARISGFLNSYYGYYNSFGIDQYGNPVEDPMDAMYLLIPGTKEMGMNKGKGMIISARATNYIANLPGPSWLVPFFVGQIFARKPDSEDELKNIVNKTIGKIPGYSYEEMFPFGVETRAGVQTVRTFTPAWARNLAIALNPQKTDKMWMDSLASEANRQQILNDMKVGPVPTEKSIFDGARSIYLRKFRTQFFSLLGSPQYVNAKPDSVYSDYYYMLFNKFKIQTNPKTGKVNTEDEAFKLAEEQFQAQMRLSSGETFPLDRLFTNTQDKATYTIPSQKAYSRIWDKYSGLAKKLEQTDPSLVGLLTADLPKDFSPQINKFLNDPNTTLPGGTILNSQLRNPKMIEDELTKSRYWVAYIDYKNQLNEAAKKAGYASYLSVPELGDALRKYANETLKAGSLVWWTEYKKNASDGDKAWLQSYGLSLITKDKEFMKELGNTQFWVHASAFIEYRDSFTKAYKDAPTGYKGKIKEQWALYLEQTLENWDPVLQKMISRYYLNDDLKETN